MKIVLLLFCLLYSVNETNMAVNAENVSSTEDLSKSECLHEYYISTCDIEFNAQKQRLEISIEFDTDDLEKALESKNNQKLRLGSKREAPETNALLLEYLNKHFIVNLNNKPANWQFLGKEVEDHHHLWIYLQVEEVDQPNTLELTHDALIHLFDKQSNIVHLKIGDKVETLVFQKGLETQKINLETIKE